MQGVKRRVVYVALYEAVAIVLATLGFMLAADAGAADATGLSVLSSAVAVLWNLAFNHGFERWEARQRVRGRGLARRVAHAVGFEGGLAAILVPVMAWWLDISLWQALVMDLGLLLLFLAYTFVFNWVFDRVFGLPRSARPV
ncbi:PACE efflux transporter [Azohydromonas lata]|uniref:PACE efflux transporter n=1 Tax=Azohydromonas lata TaxID=45677 RepID=A0ABU5IPL3_9BURK|nr:PACE efflux transporter [Azohydromonas lata]MDZ5460816.1 PACE efflux transporter [Azohydromonas lata]